MPGIDERVLSGDRALIAIVDTVNDIDRILKPGMINYTSDTQDLYLTIPTSKNFGEYKKLLVQGTDGKLDGTITFKDKILFENGFDIKGPASQIETTDLSIKDNIIEINAGETGAGITLGSAGMQINRGTKGSANILFSESDNGWIFDLNGTKKFLFDTNGILTAYGLNITGPVNVPVPTDPTDIATKKYVDDKVDALLTGGAISISLSQLKDVNITDLKTDQMIKWNGNAWINWTPDFSTGGGGGIITVPTTITREEFVAVEGQRVFNLLQGNYTIGKNMLSVYLNGSKQPNAAYVESSSSSFIMIAGLPVGTRVLAEYMTNINIDDGSGNTGGGISVLNPTTIYTEEFTAIEGQTYFVLTKGEYIIGKNMLHVYLNGSRQPDTTFVESSVKSFTMTSGLPSGVKVYVEYMNNLVANGGGSGSGGAKTYYQDNMPTASSPGEVWIKKTDKTVSIWSGDEWIPLNSYI
jgi:hypothetical protein